MFADSRRPEDSDDSEDPGGSAEPAGGFPEPPGGFFFPPARTPVLLPAHGGEGTAGPPPPRAWFASCEEDDEGDLERHWAKPRSTSRSLWDDFLRLLSCRRLPQPPQLLDAIGRKQSFLNINPDTIQQVKIARQGGLVREFWYSDDLGEVMYEEPYEHSAGLDSRSDSRASGGYKYARLYTLNSYLWDLSLCFVRVSLQVAGTISVAALCVDLFAQEHRMYRGLPDWFRWAFSLLWATGILGSATLAAVQARRHLVADSLRGDFVSEGCTGQLQVFLSLFFVHFFKVPSEIWQAPILFHPSKAIQPFGAFKKGTHRAMVAGWPIQAQYQFEQEAQGVLTGVPLLIFGGLPLLSMKTYLVWRYKGATLVMVCSFLFGFVSFVLDVRKIVRALSCRQKLYLFLHSKVDGVYPTGGDEDLELVIDWRILEQYYGEEMPHEVDVLAKELGFGGHRRPIGERPKGIISPPDRGFDRFGFSNERPDARGWTLNE